MVSGSVLLLRAMSQADSLLQLEYILMSLTTKGHVPMLHTEPWCCADLNGHPTAGGHTDMNGLFCHLKPCWWLCPCCCLPRVMSECSVLLQSGSVWMSMPLSNLSLCRCLGLGCLMKLYWCPWAVLSEGHADLSDLCCHQRSCLCLWFVMSLEN